MLISSGKREILIDPPWMNTSGALGFSVEAADDLELSRLGAFVTNPISRGARRPAQGHRLWDFPGGFMLHTGLPNPGLSAAIRRHSRQWARVPIPVIVHLLASNAEDLRHMLLRLESVDSVSGVEVGVDAIEPSAIGQLLAPVARCELPVMARLSLAAGPGGIIAAADSGAGAVCLASPRGSVVTPEGSVSGRLFGPALLPMMLEAAAAWAQRIEVPLVLSGGFRRRADFTAAFDAGAEAIQLDFALWTNPSVLLEPGRTDV